MENRIIKSKVRKIVCEGEMYIHQSDLINFSYAFKKCSEGEIMVERTFRHFYLYAKNWYIKTDNVIEDLKHIVGYRSGIDAEYITTEDVIRVLTMATKIHADFEGFIIDLFNNQRFYPDNDMNTNLVNAMLSILFCVKASEMPFEIGKPDPKILPLNDN